jgi:hypothetical protein
MGFFVRRIWLALVRDRVVDGGGYTHSQMVIADKDRDVPLPFGTGMQLQYHWRAYRAGRRRRDAGYVVKANVGFHFSSYDLSRQHTLDRIACKLLVSTNGKNTSDSEKSVN